MNLKFFILTDLEGVAGVDQFTQTRTRDLNAKGSAMTQLAREVNACIRGVREVHPQAAVDVWDGHGSGGLHPDEVAGGTYIGGDVKPYMNLAGYAGMLFVGQHAMAGTAFAPLAHTYSSLHVAYYKLNGYYIGEFGARALVAGHQGVPTLFLAGDDKAALEAQVFIPQIETAVLKRGTGLESAIHLDSDAACRLVQEATARAVRRLSDIPPLTTIEPPYTLEIRYYEPKDPASRKGPGVTWIDERTVRLQAKDLRDLPV